MSDKWPPGTTEEREPMKDNKGCEQKWQIKKAEFIMQGLTVN